MSPWACGGTGRRAWLRTMFPYRSEGSSPFRPTIYFFEIYFAAILLVILSGCAHKPPDKPSENGYSDTAIVTLHVEDNYTIRQGNVEIHATCRYTTYNTKGQEKAFDDHCLEALPVGREIKIKRGKGDWLFADWETDSIEWHMGLNRRSTY
jgi:hypothetical protein